MRINIDERYCQGCSICIHVCPKNIFQLSGKRSKRGYLMPEVINEKDCIQCGLCENYCPDICINVVRMG